MDEWTTVDRNFRTFLLVAQLDPGGIRERIRTARRQAGLTQQGLADLVDRHKRTIENWENVRVPEWSELSKLARVLDRPIEWFLYGDRDEPSDKVEAMVEALDRRLDTEVIPRLEAIEAALRELARARERV